MAAFLPVHPVFPTTDQTTQNPNLAYSDHAFIFFRVPIKDTTINCVSANTLAPGNPSGIHAKFSNWESEDEAMSRYGRIMVGLKAAVDAQNIDCIFLQETEAKLVLPQVEKLFGKEWQWQSTVAGLITLYNSHKLKPAEEEATFDHHLRILSHRFRHRETNKKVEIHNGWGYYNPFPRIREQQYRALLCPSQEGAHEDIVRIVAGDTNCRVVPVEEESVAQCTATGVIPQGLLVGQYNYPRGKQEGDNADGAFYSAAEGKIYQLPIEILDFATGQIIPNPQGEELKNFCCSNMRMVMCLDDYYRTAQILEKMTLDEYEQYLIKATEDGAIQVRMASDTHNHRGIGIRFSAQSIFPHALSQILEEGLVLEQLQSDDENNMIFPTIFVEVVRIKDLLGAMAMVLTSVGHRKNLLQKLDAEILRLQNTNVGLPRIFNTPPAFRIRQIRELKVIISQADLLMSTEKVQELIENWKNTPVPVPGAKPGETTTNGKLLEEHRNPLMRVLSDELSTSAVNLDTIKAGARSGPIL